LEKTCRRPSVTGHWFPRKLADNPHAPVQAADARGSARQPTLPGESVVADLYSPPAGMKGKDSLAAGIGRDGQIELSGAAGFSKIVVGQPDPFCRCLAERGEGSKPTGKDGDGQHRSRRDAS
jgi:hypothetical protein